MIGKPSKKDVGMYEFLNDEEVAALKPFQVMPGYSGNVACYYGNIPVDYEFHFYTDDKYSEDMAFWRDTGYDPAFLEHQHRPL